MTFTRMRCVGTHTGRQKMASRSWGAFGTALRRQSFLVRWTSAVAISVLAVGALEYAYASYQLEQRLVDQAADELMLDVGELEERVARADSASAELAVVGAELDDIAARDDTLHVAVFDAAGNLVLDLDSADAEAVSADRLAQVISSDSPLSQKEQDEGELSDENRYEFLLPLRTSQGVLVLEIDQRPELIAGLLADLRERKLLGLLLVVVCTVPLSYLLGGRSLRRRQHHADRLADTDPLTGITGRRPFRPLLQAALAGPVDTTVALVLIDIDQFKRVNDRLGHSYGDRVLVALAASFDTLRTGDRAFRLGGDEFALVLPGAHDGLAEGAVDRVRNDLHARMPGITISCGVASVRVDDRISVQELWERADSALYEAKRLGQARTSTFTEISKGVMATADKLDAVARLLEHERALSVAFQPIWDLRRRRIVGHEALLRLPPGLPLSGPAEAFELARRLAVAEDLDAAARRTALRAVREQPWQGALFLNVHPDALRCLDVDLLVHDVRAAGLEVGDVVLEVTEQADLDNPEHIRTLKAAHACGFRLALDDMGQGNAGLRALTHVRFDVIKLDKQVIARLGTDPASDAAVAAATTFVTSTGGWVIAEGIEDAQLLDRVLNDCESAPQQSMILGGQGYHLGRPAPRPWPIDTSLEGVLDDDESSPPGHPLGTGRRDVHLVEAGERSG